MAYSTGNPIGSGDPRDLRDNSENLDVAVNTLGEEEWTDRLGAQRKTWYGIEQEAIAAIQNAGYVGTGTDNAVEDYAAGIEITQYNQIVRDPSTGEFWRVSGSETLPYTTTGAGVPEGGALVSVGDAALRQELGTAAASDVTTSNTDNTSGRLMQVGDFGLGNTGDMPLYPQDMDADPTNIPAGIYKIREDQGTINSPVPAGIVRVNQGHAGRTYLEVLRAYNDGVLLFRGWARSDWQTGWRAQYHTGNILGTVSQSNGVPAGAIIERGSNANGEYAKFADGTLICTFTATSAETLRDMEGDGTYANPYGSASAIPNWNFPHPFSTPPSGAVTPSIDANPSNRRHISAQFRETTATAMRGISCTALSSSAPDLVVTFTLTAIGRWY